MKNLTILEKKELVLSLIQFCKNDAMIFFSFTLNETWIDAILTLFFIKRDLFFFTKMKFIKNLIFSLALFILDSVRIVIIFMSLKLHPVKQDFLIDQIVSEKAIVLTRKNN